MLHLTIGISLQLSRYKAPISQRSVQLMSKMRTEKKCSTGLCYNLHMAHTLMCKSFKQDYALWISNTMYNKRETGYHMDVCNSNADPKPSALRITPLSQTQGLTSVAKCPSCTITEESGTNDQALKSKECSNGCFTF